MKALILAAGYATRLYPLTETVAKPLLPVGGRPMIEHLLERIDAVPEVDGVHVVTNHKFADSFVRWADAFGTVRTPIEVHDDGTTTEDDRLGAIGDISFVVERAGVQATDLLVVAGDNLFDYSLADYVEWWRAKGEASAVALYDVGGLEPAKKYGVVELDEDDRLTNFVEKPEHP